MEKFVLLLALCLASCSTPAAEPQVVDDDLDGGHQSFIMELCKRPLWQKYPEHDRIHVRSMKLLEGGLLRGEFTMMEGPTPKVDMICDVTGDGVTVREQ